MKTGHQSPGKKPKRAKKSIKKDQIARLLRERILDGGYPPGTQIPIQLDLVQDFGMSSVTVQRAVNVLRKQGFVTAKRRVGTFVATPPPYRNKYGLVFPKDPKHVRVWSNFWEALRVAANKINAIGEKSVECFFGWEEFEKSADFLRLKAVARDHLVSGLIFSSTPHSLLGTPLMDDPRMPRATMGTFARSFRCPAVSGGCFMDLAVDYLLEQNARKIAMFATEEDFLNRWLHQQTEYTGKGVVTRSQWCFAIAADHTKTAEACTRLLMDLPKETRPEAIIVSDDHLTASVEQGILTTDDPSARETKVVALCNFPDRFAYRMPIARLGYDVPQMLQTAIDLIDAQNRGEKVPLENLIKPSFAAEQ